MALALLLIVGVASSAGAQVPEATDGKVPVAARSLPRGAVLEAEDIAFRASASGAGELAAPGWVTRRVVAEGEVLRAPAVAPPLLVKVGQEVQLVYRDGSLELRLRGQAMNAAAQGDRVTVRVDAKRRFEGVAVAAGLVRLEHTSRSR